MSNLKNEKNMQKNNNAQAFTVENIVNKYINTKNQYNPNGFDFEYCGGDELIAQLYHDVAGDNADVNVYSTILCNGKEFYDVALSNEEYEYLKEHFAETIEYVISVRASLDPAVHEVGQLPNDAAAFIARMLNLPKNSTVYLPNAGYGDAIMLLRDCNVSGYVHSKYAWAIIQIRLYAAGIKANIECLYSAVYNKNEAVKNPSFPAKGSVDVIITPHTSNLYGVKYICKEDVLFDYLKEDGQMIMFVSGRKLCGYASGISKEYLTSVIQFPCALRTGYDFTRRNHCALVYDKKKSSADTTYDLVDLTSLSMEFDMPELEEKWAYGAMNVSKALEIFNKKQGYVKHVEAKDLDEKILLPTYYFVSKSKLCHSICAEMTLADYETFVDDGTKLMIPVVRDVNLSKDFANASVQIESLKTVKKARNIWTGTLDNCITVHQPCLFVRVNTNDNSNDISVGYIKDVPPTGIVVEEDIMCLVPRDGVSLETVTLLVLSEFVQKQLKAIPFVFQFRKGMVEFLPKIVVWPVVYDDDLAIELEMETMITEQQDREIADELEMESMMAEQHDREIADELDLDAMMEEQQDREIADELELEAMMAEQRNREIADELEREATIVNQQYQGQEYPVESISLNDDPYESSECQDDNECETESIASFDELLDAMDKNSLIAFIKNQMAKENEMRKSLIESVEKQRNEIRRSQEEYRKNIHYRKHSLGQIFLNAQSNWDALLSAMKHNNGVIDTNTVYGKKHPHTIGEIMETLTGYLHSLGEGIDNFTPEDDYRFKKRVVIDLVGFIKKYIASNMNPNYTFEFINRDRTSKMEISFSEPALKEILQNIVFNAWRHGFKNREDNIIRFELQKHYDMIDLVISNNGIPIDKEIMRNDIFRYGTTSKRGVIEDGHAHQGLGMFRAKCFMEDTGGSIVCVCNKESKFPVSFKLSFKSIKIERNDKGIVD